MQNHRQESPWILQWTDWVEFGPYSEWSTKAKACCVHLGVFKTQSKTQEFFQRANSTHPKPGQTRSVIPQQLQEPGSMCWTQVHYPTYWVTICLSSQNCVWDKRGTPYWEHPTLAPRGQVSPFSPQTLPHFFSLISSRIKWKSFSGNLSLLFQFNVTKGNLDQFQIDLVLTTPFLPFFENGVSLRHLLRY